MIVPKKKPRVGGVRRRPGSATWTVRDGRVIELKPDADRTFVAVPKLERMIDALGLSATADVLGVDKSQLSRCLKAQERLSAELTRRISDLEYVIDRALQVMNPEDVGPWLSSPEPLLGNSIPMTVLTLTGPARVIGAIDAMGAGAFA